jgi:hypothetical protein
MIKFTLFLVLLISSCRTVSSGKTSAFKDSVDAKELANTFVRKYLSEDSRQSTYDSGDWMTLALGGGAAEVHSHINERLNKILGAQLSYSPTITGPTLITTHPPSSHLEKAVAIFSAERIRHKIFIPILASPELSPLAIRSLLVASANTVLLAPEGTLYGVNVESSDIVVFGGAVGICLSNTIYSLLKVHLSRTVIDREPLRRVDLKVYTPLTTGGFGRSLEGAIFDFARGDSTKGDEFVHGVVNDLVLFLKREFPSIRLINSSSLAPNFMAPLSNVYVFSHPDSRTEIVVTLVNSL